MRLQGCVVDSFEECITPAVHLPWTGFLYLSTSSLLALLMYKACVNHFLFILLMFHGYTLWCCCYNSIFSLIIRIWWEVSVVFGWQSFPVSGSSVCNSLTSYFQRLFHCKLRTLPAHLRILMIAQLQYALLNMVTPCGVVTMQSSL